MLCQRGQGFLRHIVRLEVQDSDAVLFQKGTVHNTLQQHLLVFKSFPIAGSIVQKRELEFPQMGSTAAQLPANGRVKKRRDAPAVCHGRGLLRDEAGIPQPPDLPIHSILIRAVFVADILHDPVDGAAIGLALYLPTQKSRLAPVSLYLAGFGSILCRFLILDAALSLGSRHLRRCQRCRPVGIVKGECLLQLPHCPLRRLSLLRCHRPGDRIRSGCLYHHDFPWSVRHPGLIRSAAQGMELACLRAQQRAEQHPFPGA